ncbi:MAG TPA: MotA/TolQ/ExbB proton channel family protein [Stellaceae bacterium]|nr:MotA/TolQ/ExbB proton channel family protein [Stellaceae bacterium]
MPTLIRSSLAFVARSPVMALAIGFALVLGAVMLSTGSLLAFFSVEGLVIVAGGVIAVAFMSFESEDVHAALGTVASLFKKGEPTAPDTLHGDMTEIIAWAAVVKEKGVRWLETSLAKSGIADPFVKYGLNMVVSGYSPEDVRAMMETAADAAYERESMPVDVLQSMTSHAPAFGMIGTLVGMVAMLCSLSENVASVGSSLSVAFLSTLYGVVSARVLYMPAAAKLRHVASKRRFRNQLVTEGMVMLVSNKSPMYVKDRLNSFLRPEWHDYADSFKAVAKPGAVQPPAAPVVQPAKPVITSVRTVMPARTVVRPAATTAPQPMRLKVAAA